MSAARIAVLGGSSAFTPALSDALAARAGDLPELDVALYGRRARRAELVAHACAARATAARAPHRYRGTASLEDALDGASVVVLQVRVGGWAGRAYDETFPLDAGIPGDETIGPGGLCAGIRAAATVRALGEAVAARGERPRLVQMANPMGILLRVLADVPGIEATGPFGLCELPGVVLRDALARVDAQRERPDAQRERIDADYAGLNHQGWFTHVAHPGVATPLPLPYLELYTARDERVAGLRARTRSRGDELAALDDALLARYAERAGPKAAPPAIGARATPWYDLALAPVLAALLGGPPCEAYVSEPNRGHLDFLPDDAIVEKRARVDASGPRAIPLRHPVPGDLRAFLARVAAFEAAAATAALHPGDAAVAAALRVLPPELGRLDERGLRALTAAVLAGKEVGA